MHIDPIIKKRFFELNSMMLEVENTKQPAEIYGYVYNIEKMSQWYTSTLSLLKRVFGTESIHYSRFLAYSGSSGTDGFIHCQGIFRAAKDDYENGYLFDVQSLVKAEILSGDVLEEARELLNVGYKDSACVLAGIALEVALKDISSRNEVAHGKLDRMNTELCKAGVYNMGKQKQITAWADIRNNAAHGNFGEYSVSDVKSLIEGVTAFIGDYL